MTVRIWVYYLKDELVDWFSYPPCFMSLCLSFSVCVLGTLSGEEPATHIHPEAAGVFRPGSHTQGECVKASWFSSARGVALSAFRAAHD